MSVQGFVITQADMLSHTKPVYYMREKGEKNRTLSHWSSCLAWAHVVILGFICGGKIIVLLEMLSLNGLINKGQII